MLFVRLFCPQEKSIEQYIYEFWQSHNKGFDIVRQQCTIFYDNYVSNLNTFDNKSDNDTLWITQQYKKFLVEYVWQEKIENSIFAKTKFQDRVEATFETTVVFPNLLLYVYNYDETFGFKNWDNFRFIQMEWLYANMHDGLSIIKCWIQMSSYNPNFQFESNRIDSNSFDAYQNCPKVFFNDKKYYQKMKEKFDKLSDQHKNSWTIESNVNKQYKQRFLNFYKPCNDALYALVLQRHEILIGNWFDWDGYTFPLEHLWWQRINHYGG